MPEITKNKFTSGSAIFDHCSPEWADITSDTKALNVVFSYEEALKLHMALQHRLMEIASYNKTLKKGRKAGVNLTFFMKKEISRVAVNPGEVR